MKNLFASVSYSFNNFYNNLNAQGQMIFSSIMILIAILCVLLLLTYVVQGMQTKSKLYKAKHAKKKVKKEDALVEIKLEEKTKDKEKEKKLEEVKNIKKEENRFEKTEVIEEIKPQKRVVKEPIKDLYVEEKTEILDIAKRVEDALKEENPINLTTFEEDQEKTAIISIDELIKRAKELEIIEDEDNTGVNYLEKYNLEASAVENAVNNTMKKEQTGEVKAFKVSQVISPIYGVKKETIDNRSN